MGTALLRELGFGEGLVRHLLNYDESSTLARFCQPPLHWLSSPISKRPIVALWESGIVLTYFHKEEQSYQKCSLEDVDDVWVKYRSPQALLADLFLDMYEAELTDQELRRIAMGVGFVHIERFLAEVGADDRGDYGVWRNGFPSTCEV